MSYVRNSIVVRARVLAPVALLLGLVACSGKDESATPAADAKPAAAATPAAAPSAAPAVSSKVQAMGSEQLRESASQALRDNRMYAPAGDNAMEYYLALRDKTPDDASVKSALTDLLPYTLIAAEQNMAREDFDEAQRLIALIEKVDPKAPALPRLKQGISRGVEVAAQRTTEETERVKREAEAKTKQLAEQQKLAEQRTREAAAAQQIATQQAAAAPAAAAPAPAAQDAERQATARREAEQRQQQAAAQAAAAASARQTAAPTLRPVSTPAPRYPADALRSGTSGEVLVEITVGTDGTVTSARVLRANPARIFDREAMAAVKRWRFEPVAAPVTTRRTLAFSPGG